MFGIVFVGDFTLICRKVSDNNGQRIGSSGADHEEVIDLCGD
jgi:hypothetical protein